MAHIRLDSGVESGSDVSIHYDPMLAKVIAWVKIGRNTSPCESTQADVDCRCNDEPRILTRRFGA